LYILKAPFETKIARYVRIGFQDNGVGTNPSCKECCGLLNY
jgi:hypothetical protein